MQRARRGRTAARIALAATTVVAIGVGLTVPTAAQGRPLTAPPESEPVTSDVPASEVPATTEPPATNPAPRPAPEVSDPNEFDVDVQVSMNGYLGDWSVPISIDEFDLGNVGSDIVSGSGSTSNFVSFVALARQNSYSMTADFTGFNLEDAFCDNATLTPIDGDTWSIDPGLSEAVTCTLVLEADPFVLTIRKSTIAPEGDYSFDFELSANGDVIVTPGIGLARPGSVSSIIVPVPAGAAYSLNEVVNELPWLVDYDCSVLDDDVNGYVDVDHDNIPTVPGGAAQCDVVNELGVWLEVSKYFQTADDAGAVGTFEGSWPGGAFTVPDGETARVAAPSTFSLTEITEGFIATGRCFVFPLGSEDPSGSADFESGTVVIAAPPGSTIECDVYNEAQPVLYLTKQTEDDDPTVFDFEINGSYNVSLSDGESSSDTDTGDGGIPMLLDDNIIVEEGVGGWKLVDVECSGSVYAGEADGEPYFVDDDSFFVNLSGDEFVLGNLKPNGVYECTAYNERSATVDKTALSLEPLEEVGHYRATYEIEVTNPGETSAEFDLLDQLSVGWSVSVIDDSLTVVAVPESALVANTDFNGMFDTLLGTVTVEAGSSVIITVTVDVDVDPATSDWSRECASSAFSEGGGLENRATLSDGEVTIDTDRACLDIPLADIEVHKDAVGAPDRVDPYSDELGGWVWQQTYEVTVENEGEGHGLYSLWDGVAFGSPFPVLDVTVNDPLNDTTTVFTSEDHDLSWMEIVEEMEIAPIDAHTYEVIVRFLLPMSQEMEIDLDEYVCAEADGVEDTGWVGGYGLYNRAWISVGGTIELSRLTAARTEFIPIEDEETYDEAEACVRGPRSNLAIDKLVEDYAYPEGTTDEVTVTYTIILDNPDGETDAAPSFAYLVDIAGGFEVAGIEPLEVSVDAVTTDTDPSVGGEGIAEYEANEGYLYGVGLVPPSATQYWTVSVTYSVDVFSGFDGTCPNPGDDGVFQFDELFVDEGEAIAGGLSNLVLGGDAIELELSDGDDGFLFPFFPGSPESAGSRQRTDTIIDVGSFDEEMLPGGFEHLQLAVACVDASAVWIDKEVVNDGGGSAEPEDFSFALYDADGDLHRTVPSGTPTVVVTGDYDLVEEYAPGYESDGFACESTDLRELLDEEPDTLSLTESIRGWRTNIIVRQKPSAVISLEMEGSYGYSCDITNDDMVVDLGIVKEAGAATVVAGGAPVMFTFTVTNEGQGDPESDAVAMLTDELPAGLQWVAGTVSGCANATPLSSTTTLECEIDPDDLEAGESVVVTAQAQAPADAESGDATNVATVSSDADPAPDAVCPRGDGEVSAPNVSCATVGITRAATMTATKVSDATGPVSSGATVTFTLTATNNGPSTLLSLKLVDDLPNGLVFQSVSAPGWLCVPSDPVVCTYDAVVGVGTSPSPVVITTKVGAGATGTITNTGLFTGVVDVSVEGSTTAAPRQRSEQAVVVTVSAVASAVATVQVRSGGTLPRTGGDLGSVIGWGIVGLCAGWVLVGAARRRHLFG